MRRSLLVIMATVSAVWVMGCAQTRELSKTNKNLQDKLKTYRSERDALRKRCENLEKENTQLKEKLKKAQESTREMSELLGQLEQARKQRKKKLDELRKLVADISGMRIEPRQEGDFIIIENKILFAAGKIALNEDAQTTLKSTVVAYINKTLAEKPNQKFRIDGHTDGQPIRHSEWKDNYHLAAMRAHSVMSYLHSQGVPKEKMYISAFGPNRPLVKPKKPESDTPKNRRVEILMVPRAAEGIDEVLEQFGR
ncbi:MAG: OmpA family protein [Candidatus Brocadiia bacterium]